MFSLSSCFRYSPPIPPTPTPARLSLSLGAVWPGPPSTWRGSSIMPVSAAAARGANSRQESVCAGSAGGALSDKESGSLVLSSMIWPARHDIIRYGSPISMDNTILRKDFLRSALGLPLLLTGGGRLAQVSAQSDSHNQAAPSAEELGKYYAKKRYDPAPLPQWQSVHGQLPPPIYESQPNWIAMYWKSWELAFRNFHEPATGSGFVSQFIDAAFNANIFLWDSCFMTMFCNYAHPLVPGIGTLDNFYAKQHEDGEICREIVRNTGVDFSQWVNRENRPLFSRWGKEPSTPFVPYDVVYRGRPAPKQNPKLTLDGLNHPILAWAELESYRMTGDTARLGRIWEPLVHYYAALEEYLRQGNGLYMTDWASMDNSTRNAYLDRGGTGIDISSE